LGDEYFFWGEKMFWKFLEFFWGENLKKKILKHLEKITKLLKTANLKKSLK
jgi:hypothetical protein